MLLSADSAKLEALREINAHFDALLTNTNVQAFVIEQLVNVALKILESTQPQFIAENNTQLLRKLMLEILFRLPYNEYMRQHSRRLIQVLVDTVQKENEGNVRTAIQLLCNLQKTFRPNYSQEVSDPFQFWTPWHSSPH